MPPSYESNKNNPFGAINTIGGVDVERITYDQFDEEQRGRVVAIPMSIFDLAPDERQPRRAMPHGIRSQWGGRTQDLPATLRYWERAASELLGYELDTRALILGKSTTEDGEDRDLPAVAADYLALCNLAASIHLAGLINPITAVKNGKGGVIETGERRWLAFHLLDARGGGNYKMIPTVLRAGKIDPWKQAAENGSRRPLNAIGMARQLALLIMAMYDGDDGVLFNAFSTLVLPGGCDLPFYAQVANGNVFPVKYGQAQRILDVTGLKSAYMIRAYRALLKLPEDLWIKADEGNWTEGRIREYMAGLLSEESETSVAIATHLDDFDYVAEVEESETSVAIATHLDDFDAMADGDEAQTSVAIATHVEPPKGNPAAQINPPRPPQPAQNRATTNRDHGRAESYDDDDEDGHAELRGTVGGAHPALFAGNGASSMQPTRVYDTSPILGRPGFASAQALLQLMRGKAKRDGKVVLVRYMTEILAISEADLARRRETPEQFQSYLESVMAAINEDLGDVLKDTTKLFETLLDVLKKIQDELSAD